MGADEDCLVPANLGAVWLIKRAGRTVDDDGIRRHAALIRKWAQRGKIGRHGTQGRSILYSLRELEQHAECHRPLTS